MQLEKSDRLWSREWGMSKRFTIRYLESISLDITCAFRSSTHGFLVPISHILAASKGQRFCGNLGKFVPQRLVAEHSSSRSKTLGMRFKC